MAELPLSPEPNRRKLIFAGIVGLIVVVILGAMLYLSRGSSAEGGEGFDPESTTISVWTVAMEPTIFESLVKGFNDYVGRSDMKIQVRSFGSYEDYLDMLPRVVQTGTSPDIVVVPNHGGHMLLDPYIVALGEDLIDFADFESRYHAIFSDELIFEEKQKVNGSNQIIRGIRGIPVGFEPMGMYYNRDMLSGVPTYWADIMDQLTEETKTSGLPAFSLGYGRATPYSADILAIRTMQYEGADFSTYAQIDTVESRGMIEKYLDFRRAPNNMSQYEDILKNTRTATDLFTRGKVATLIGYPSTVKDIQLAEKRAKKDKELVESFADNIRWTTIPQVSDDPKEQLNLGRYMYFALAKYGTNRNPDKPGDDPAIKFLQFLNTEKAQKTFFNNHTYYLPSQLSLLTEEAKTQIDGDNGPGMTVGDWYVPTQKFIPYDMGIPHLFLSISEKALDEPGATSSVISGNILAFMSCKINHLTDPDTYERACGCRNDTDKNNNNYWPLCEWGI